MRTSATSGPQLRASFPGCRLTFSDGSLLGTLRYCGWSLLAAGGPAEFVVLRSKRRSAFCTFSVSKVCLFRKPRIFSRLCWTSCNKLSLCWRARSVSHCASSKFPSKSRMRRLAASSAGSAARSLVWTSAVSKAASSRSCRSFSVLKKIRCSSSWRERPTVFAPLLLSSSSCNTDLRCRTDSPSPCKRCCHLSNSAVAAVVPSAALDRRAWAS
mmetsp:Transcript_29548/g.66521  ORF Transcript_29548/g.66521 Transcript_29548/m.66521 type:complete len:213 (-) Transcript_29548:284-922(-)